MNDNIILADAFHIGFLEYILSRASGQVISIKKTPYMRSQITTAAGDEDLHNSIKGDN